MKIRDRVKELRRVLAGDLAPSPKNWRTHPPAQQDALRGALAEIGYADALLARELPGGGLELIDGHLRAETTPDAVVPVLVLDLDEAEAAKLLATLDPLAAMATADAAKLDALLREVETANDGLAAMLTGLAEKHGVIPPADEPTPPEDFGAYDENIPTEHQCPKCGYRWSGGKAPEADDADHEGHEEEA